MQIAYHARNRKKNVSQTKNPIQVDTSFPALSIFIVYG
jgi:hypothetical protein